MIGSALVLAAGKSTRISSISGSVPKPLMPFAGRPIIARTLAWLSEYGITDVWVNLHYRPSLIRETLGDGSQFGVRIRYSEEPTILGTAGAARLIASHLAGTTLVVYGDNVMRFDLDRFLEAHQRTGLPGSVALFDQDVHANTRIAGGRVELDPLGRIRAFVEGGGDGGSTLVNAGAYLLEPQLIAQIGTGFQDFGADVFPPLVRERALNGYIIESDGYCLGVDTPESYAVANTLIATNSLVLK